MLLQLKLKSKISGEIIPKLKIVLTNIQLFKIMTIELLRNIIY